MNNLKKMDAFKPQSRNCHRNALVGSYFSNDLGLYIDGFYRAASVVVDSLDKGEPSNTLVYPVCFLYRHFIEIALKEIISRCLRLDRSDLTRNVKRLLGEHNLGRLLKKADELVKKHFPTSFSDEVKSTILEIYSVDPGSDFFRYHASKNGHYFLPAHDVIGLGTLKEKMSGIHDELKGALIGLDEYLKIEAEIEAECLDTE